MQRRYVIVEIAPDDSLRVIGTRTGAQFTSEQNAEVTARRIREAQRFATRRYDVYEIEEASV